MDMIFELEKEAEKGQASLAETIKILVYKTNNEYGNMLDFSNDYIFLEPLLFAYFNAGEKSITLDQILWGYMHLKKRPQESKVISNEKGIIYLPNYGYYFTEFSNESFIITCCNEMNNAILWYNGEEINCEFVPVEKVLKTNLEILKANCPILKDWFRIYKTHIPHREREYAKINIIDTTEKHKDSLIWALDSLKSSFPKVINLLLKNSRLLIIQDHFDCITKVTPEVHGALFFSVQSNNSKVYFLDKLLELLSYNFINAALKDRRKWFTGEDEEDIVLEDIIPSRKGDTRTIYRAYAWIFPVYIRIFIFDYFIRNRNFDREDLFELYGRLLDQFKKANGLEYKETQQYLTKEGMDLYKDIYNRCKVIASNYTFLPNLLNLPKLAEFHKEKFLELNDEEQFFKAIDKIN